jgi:predicted anti-sigma-YlaC factor YlaD
MHGVQAGCDDTIAAIGEEDPPHTREMERGNGRDMQIILKKQNGRYRSLVSWVAIGLIEMRMRALQLKLTLAHSVMGVKKHECARTLRPSILLGLRMVLLVLLACSCVYSCRMELSFVKFTVLCCFRRHVLIGRSNPSILDSANLVHRTSKNIS